MGNLTPLRRLVHRARLSIPCDEGRVDAALGAWRLRLEGLRAQGRVMSASLFRDGYSLFHYCEPVGAPLTPVETGAPGAELLAPWPELEGDLPWMPMQDVFHFNAPASVDHWRRIEPPRERQGRLLRLRPERVASYVYYHYQLQEERAFLGEKYKCIALHGTLLFMYNELPAVVEPPPLPGALATHGTPPDWADARMDLHFIPWDEHTPYSRGLPCVFAV